MLIGLYSLISSYVEFYGRELVALLAIKLNLTINCINIFLHPHQNQSQYNPNYLQFTNYLLLWLINLTSYYLSIILFSYFLKNNLQNSLSINPQSTKLLTSLKYSTMKKKTHLICV